MKTLTKLKKKFKNMPWKKIFTIAGAALLVFIGAGLIWAATIKMPDISTFEARKIANSSKITDRTGEIVLYDIHQSVRRTEIPLIDMGVNVKNAVISIEDEHFYQHNGIRPTSILRAIGVNILKGGFSQGGSTITQQIIKNTLLNTDKSIIRKFKEWVLAVRLERQFSKDQILQIYLNDAPFGSTIYGVEEASHAFFNKNAKDLTVSEGSYLAAMLPAPTYYSPFGKNRVKLDARHDLVLKKMKDNGYLTNDEYNVALAETVTFNAQASNSIKAPHFVFYILDYLQQKYGEDVMESGGYTIKTTLDYDMQQKAETMVHDAALKNEKQYNATNQALVAMDPKTGQILSMVGSRDYFDKAIDGAFNVATAFRQPGSSFKPFVYATAFEKGYTPETILFDVPTEFSTSCNPSEDKTCYHPNNFDDKFKGPISLRSAIAESRNVPSVKLLYLVGIDSALKTAHDLGITTLQNPKDYGLSLVLGGGEVSLLDMVGAYGTFAQAGVHNPTTAILDIKDHDGNTIEQYQRNETQVMDKNAALTLDDILSDPAARAPTFGSSITIPNVAVKTGTTNEERDAWIIGYTPDVVVGVWSGNNNNRSMRKGGAAVSGPVWKAFMETVVLPKIPAVAFEKPLPDADTATLKSVLRGIWKGNETVDIDKVTGLRATDATPPESREERLITSVHDILYWVDKDDPRGPVPTNPTKDPQFKLWESGVQTWWMEHQGEYGITTQNDLPTDYDTLHGPDAISTPIIKGLPNRMKTTDSATVSINTTGKYPLASVDIYVGNDYLTSLEAPFSFIFSPANHGYDPGTYTIRVVGKNTVYAQKEVSKQLTITSAI